MNNIFKLVVGGWQKWLAYLGVACLIFGAGSYTGYQYRDRQEAHKQVEAIVKQVDTKDQNQAIADTTGKRVSDNEQKTRIVYKTIEKEVIRYVEKDPDSGERIGTDWVRLHDAAASGQLAPNSTDKPSNKVHSDGVTGKP